MSRMECSTCGARYRQTDYLLTLKGKPVLPVPHGLIAFACPSGHELLCWAMRTVRR